MLRRLIALLLFVYSVAAFAGVDINTATQADLESINGIGPVIATKILDERKKGPFKDWADLMGRVKGVRETSAAKFSADGLTVNGKPFGAAPAASPRGSSGTAKR